jgi:hypothetical protein
MTINRLLILAPTSRFTLIEVDIGEHCQLKNENIPKLPQDAGFSEHLEVTWV